MVDLHSHILPNVDDGSKSMEESLRLIQLEQANGVEAIAFTPHFRYEYGKISDFAKKRDNAHQNLLKEMRENRIDMPTFLGAEVYLYPEIVYDADKDKLTIGGTDYMLVELSMTSYYDWVPRILYNLKLDGIIPIIAHVERYPYLRNKPELLYDLVSAGAVAQVNARSIAEKSKSRDIVWNFIENNLVHIIATDTHSVKHRPPYMKEAMVQIDKKFGSEYTQYFVENSRTITQNK
ncbi:MAG TPA: CpsB/CapC family capsule biosynthesis tyrosine phosphatase, partial [Ruminiclostridium sp.]|nr:CpsB/CapC family capsule biosynthesis tyrosine phosphatase [Ruminiclostridium sp.]